MILFCLHFAGEFDRAKQDRQEQKFGVKKIFIHPKYNNQDVAYDIALLQLDRKEKRNAFVNQVIFIVNHILDEPSSEAVSLGHGIKHRWPNI